MSGSTVDLELDAPLPAALSSACPGGDPSELRILVLVPPSEVCEGAVEDGRAQVCCPGVESGVIVDVSVLYEVGATSVRLAEQLVRLDLTDPASNVVQIDISATSVNDFGSNRTDWCN